MSKVKDGNYIVIQSWMVKDLKLKGNELLVYAIIYGFSQDGETFFEGSLQYIADWTNSTRQGISNALKSLVAKNLIEKRDRLINGVKFCDYRTIQLAGVYNKVDGGVQQSLTGGVQQSLTHNLSTDKQKDNLIDKTKDATAPASDDIQTEFNLLWSLYPRKQGKANAYKAYAKARKGHPEIYKAVEDGIRAYEAHIKANKTDPQYVKHGSTWFNQKCWEDDYTTGGGTHGSAELNNGQNGNWGNIGITL